MLSGYTYEGGAHGNPYRSCLTFDSETGKKLTAANVFGISKKQLNDKVHKLYLAKFDKNDPYALGPYAAGYIQVSAVIK